METAAFTAMVEAFVTKLGVVGTQKRWKVSSHQKIQQWRRGLKTFPRDAVLSRIAREEHVTIEDVMAGLPRPDNAHHQLANTVGLCAAIAHDWARTASTLERAAKSEAVTFLHLGTSAHGEWRGENALTTCAMISYGFGLSWNSPADSTWTYVESVEDGTRYLSEIIPDVPNPSRWRLLSLGARRLDENPTRED